MHKHVTQIIKTGDSKLHLIKTIISKLSATSVNKCST